MDEDLNWVFVFLFFILGIVLGGMIVGLFFDLDKLNIREDVAIDICQQLTGEPDTKFEVRDCEETWESCWKLYCIRPSFDNTQNIIIKGNGEKNG